MTLKELKQMIAEEYAAFKKKNNLSEQDMPPMPAPDMMGGAPGGPTVDVSDKDVDVEEKDAEAILKKVFDMLNDYMKGDEDDKPKAPKKPADKGGDDKPKAKGKEDKEDKGDDEEVKENSTIGNYGFKALKESKKGKRRLIKRSNPKAKTSLAEAKMKSRFQKLANI